MFLTLFHLTVFRLLFVWKNLTLITTTGFISSMFFFFFHVQLLMKTCQHLWLTLDPVLSSNAFFFLTISVLLDGFAFKCFFVVRFCFSLLFKIILILGSWTSDAFTQCATNDEIFGGEIFWLHVVIHAPTREQPSRWQIFYKEGFVNTEASFNKGLSLQKRKDDFQYFNQLFKTFLCPMWFIKK